MASSHNKPRRKVGNLREVRPGVWEVRVSKGYRDDGKQRVAYRTVKGSEADAIAESVRLADEMGRCLTTGDPMTLDTYFWGYFMPAQGVHHHKGQREHLQVPLQGAHRRALRPVGNLKNRQRRRSALD